MKPFRGFLALAVVLTAAAVLFSVLGSADGLGGSAEYAAALGNPDTPTVGNTAPKASTATVQPATAGGNPFRNTGASPGSEPAADAPAAKAPAPSAGIDLNALPAAQLETCVEP